VELVAKLQKIKDLQTFFPLFLTGSAYNVYKSLEEDDKEDYAKVKAILVNKFCSDSCLAYEELIRRKFLPGETVEAYYADISRLLKLVDPDAKEILFKSAFLAGLPNDIKDKIRSSNDVIVLSISDVIQRAKSIIKSAEICNVAQQSKTYESKVNDYNQKQTCFVCRKVGHFAKTCPNKYCFVCGEKNHVASQCEQRSQPKN